MIVRSESIKTILPKLLEVQKALKTIPRSAKNPFYNSTYADLPAVLDTIKPLLNERGLLLMQPVSSTDAGSLVVETYILDAETTEYVGCYLTMPLAKTDPQGIGSGISYGRRYVLGALMAAVTDEDDDGNAASGVTKRKDSTATKEKEAAKSAPKEGEGGEGNGQLSPVDVILPFIHGINSKDELKKYYNDAIKGNKTLTAAQKKEIAAVITERAKSLDAAEAQQGGAAA